MKAIIAVNNLGYIGLNNGLPWSNSKDLKHFKELTSKSDKNDIPKLVVGFNTAQTLPKLKGRDVQILPKRNTDSHFLFMRNDLYNIDWCIGGKSTYEQLCHMFTELHISYIDDNTVGDTVFPDLQNLPRSCKIFKYYF